MNNQIMLGNYIKRNGVVVQADEQTFWDMKHYPEQFEFIEISHKWLKRLGFKLYLKSKNYNCYQNSIGMNVSMWMQDYKVAGFENKGSCYFGDDFTEIKYVHTLQNLHYLLTNKQLK